MSWRDVLFVLRQFLNVFFLNGLCHWIRTNPLASEANNSSSLLTINKSFIRPHLDYRDKIYDQPNNNGLSEKIEPI